MDRKKNRKKLLFIIIIVIFTCGPVFGQLTGNNKKSKLGIGLGYSFNGYREETIVDINRYLNTFFFTLNYNLEKNRLMHTIGAGFYRGISKAVIASPVYIYEIQPDIYGQLYQYYQAEDTWTRFFLEYAQDWKLWGNSTFPGYFGGAVRADIYLIETLINPVYINFSGIISLDLHISQKWIINAKNSLVLSLSFPFFGYAIRPHYIGFSAWPVENRITSLHNYWAGFGNLKYYFAISRLFSLYSDIGFELSNINFPRPRKDAAFRICLGIAWTF